LSRQAISRQTNAASELESWMDEVSDDLSANLFDGLEKVAESIDDMVGVLNESLDDAEDEVESLREDIRTLEYRIEELEES